MRFELNQVELSQAAAQYVSRMNPGQLKEGDRIRISFEVDRHEGEWQTRAFVEVVPKK